MSTIIYTNPVKFLLEPPEMIPEVYEEPQIISVLDSMNFRALDENFNVIQFLEAYDSIIWTETYSGVGEFELYGSDNEQLRSILINASYIFNTATQKLMIIEKTNVENDAEDGTFITLSGRSFESFLDRRIIFSNLTYLSDSDMLVSDIIKDLIDRSFVNPVDLERAWDSLTVVNDTSLGSPIIPANTPLQFDIGENLLAVIEELCSIFNLGVRCQLSTPLNTITLTIYEGINHLDVDRVSIMFSDQQDNIISSKETLSFGHVKTAVLVAGNHVDANTNLPLLTQLVSVPELTGLNRKEFYLKTELEKLIYDSEGNTTPMTDLEYESSLYESGAKELISEHNRVNIVYDGEIIETLASRYLNHFNLGDIVGFLSPHGHRKSARLSGITFSNDEQSGKTLAPMFDFDL